MDEISIEVAIRTYKLDVYVRISELDAAVRSITETSMKPVIHYIGKDWGSDARKAAEEGAVNVLKVSTNTATIGAGLLFAIVIRHYLRKGCGGRCREDCSTWSGYDFARNFQ